MIYSTEADYNPTILRKRKDILPDRIKVASYIHIGYLYSYKGHSIYRIWIPLRITVLRTRDIVFNKSKFYSRYSADLGINLTNKELTNYSDLEEPQSPILKHQFNKLR